MCFCADAVELREIGIEHYLFAANEEHELNASHPLQPGFLISSSAFQSDAFGIGRWMFSVDRLLAN